MQINKALITAAGPGQSALPLQRLVDRDGVEKTALEMILGKVAKSGIESVAIVISPGNEEAYRRAAGGFVERLTFVTQPEPTGYGQAILCAKSFLEDAPFLHLVGDHLYLSSQDKGCVKQLIEVATAEECSVSGVQATRETMLPFYGAIGGIRLPQTERLYGITCRKPFPSRTRDFCRSRPISIFLNGDFPKRSISCWRFKTRRVRRSSSQVRSREPTTNLEFKHSQIRCDGAFARFEATNGCFESAIRVNTRFV